MTHAEARWRGYWRMVSYLRGEWGLAGHNPTRVPATGRRCQRCGAPVYGSRVIRYCGRRLCQSTRESCRKRARQGAILALTAAISLGCAATTVTARYDAEGHLRACHVTAAEVARVVTATCTPEALAVHHAPESGWAGRAISAVAGWLAARFGG